MASTYSNGHRNNQRMRSSCPRRAKIYRETQRWFKIWFAVTGSAQCINVVSLTPFLRGGEEHFPTLLTWVYYCYGGELAYLPTGETFLRSITGVQKGDPLGPLLFDLSTSVAATSFYVQTHASYLPTRLSFATIFYHCERRSTGQDSSRC